MINLFNIIEHFIEADMILDKPAVREIKGAQQLYPCILHRPPLVEADVQQQKLTVYLLPSEIRETTINEVRCLDLSGVSRHRHDAVLAILTAVLRVNVDLSAGDAIAGIASSIERLDAVAEQFAGAQTFSMAAELRRMVGEASTSQDTAARILRSKVPDYVKLDSLAPYWVADVATHLGTSPYIFWPRFQDRLDTDKLFGDKRMRIEDAAISHIKEPNPDRLANLAEYINPLMGAL